MWWARLRLPCRTILNSPGLEGTRICLRPIWMSALRGLYEKPVKSEQRVQMDWRCGLGDGECRCEVQTTSHAWSRLNLDQRGVMLQCRCLKMGWRHVEWNNMVGKEPVNLRMHGDKLQDKLNHWNRNWLVTMSAVSQFHSSSASGGSKGHFKMTKLTYPRKTAPTANAIFHRYWHLKTSHQPVPTSNYFVCSGRNMWQNN